MNFRTVQYLLMALLVATCSFDAYAREWTAIDGRKLEAEYLGFDGDYVYVRRSSDGKIYRVGVRKLSEEDRLFARQQLKACLADLERELIEQALRFTAEDYLGKSGAATADERHARTVVKVLRDIAMESNEELQAAEAEVRARYVQDEFTLARAKYGLEATKAFGNPEVIRLQAEADRYQTKLMALKRKLTAIDAGLAAAIARAETKMYDVMTEEYAVARVEFEIEKLRLSSPTLVQAQETVKRLRKDLDLPPDAHLPLLADDVQKELTDARERARHLIEKAIRDSPKAQRALEHANAVRILLIRREGDDTAP